MGSAVVTVTSNILGYDYICAGLNRDFDDMVIGVKARPVIEPDPRQWGSPWSDGVCGAPQSARRYLNIEQS